MADLRKQLVKKLKTLDANITGQDKLDACRELPVSRPTLDKYLDGEVADVEKAVSIIEFFSHRITDRLKRIQAI